VKQSNNQSETVLLLHHVSDWVDSLIGSSGWLLRSLSRSCSPSFSFMGGVGKVLKTWRSNQKDEIFNSCIIVVRMTKIVETF